MHKEIYNLLSIATANISLDSASAFTLCPPKCAVFNQHGKTGNLYIDVSDFSTPTGLGFVPRLYYSYDGASWFVGSSLPSTDTALSSVYPVDNLGRYVRFGYDINAQKLNNAKVFLEINQEYGD